ncbi:UBP-type zinc finger domain-containing protein [Anaeromyxobacter terrae]|uniref:UBP-type zinc finger domain-containing protein n=1 Tax=Anaeromyxobacter terrae TaxID=2925406 RepID=UPI001F59456F|nr:UBP-type zinc finger domain-containing protein [Anaeromyxobacter sp. SG22]
MCEHLSILERPRARPLTPSSHGCKECLEAGDTWVQLRLCMTCGHVGCCDSSRNKHATRHFQATKHPVVKAFEPGQDWAWCYVHEEMAEAIPAFPEESPREHYGAHPRGFPSP